MTKSESEKLESYILQHFPMSNQMFSQKLGVTVDVIKYHIRKLGLVGVRKRGKPRLYDEAIKAEYPKYSATIIATKLEICRNTVNRIAKQIGVSHNHGFQKIPKPFKENLVGTKYGKLTVKKQLGTNKWGQMIYLCVCKCGQITQTSAGNLKHGITTSCGCNRKNKHKNESNK